MCDVMETKMLGAGEKQPQLSFQTACASTYQMFWRLKMHYRYVCLCVCMCNIPVNSLTNKLAFVVRINTLHMQHCETLLRKIPTRWNQTLIQGTGLFKNVSASAASHHIDQEQKHVMCCCVFLWGTVFSHDNSCHAPELEINWCTIACTWGKGGGSRVFSWGMLQHSNEVCPTGWRENLF